MIPDRVKAVLDANGLAALEFEPDSTPTSPLAAAKIGCAVGQIAKSLLFVGKDGSLFMVVAQGDRRIAQAKLKAAVGVKFRMTQPEETLAATGYPPGGRVPVRHPPEDPDVHRRRSGSPRRHLPRGGHHVVGRADDVRAARGDHGRARWGIFSRTARKEPDMDAKATGTRG